MDTSREQNNVPFLLVGGSLSFTGSDVSLQITSDNPESVILAVVISVISRFQGTVLRSHPSHIAVVFPSPVNALRAGIEMQRELDRFREYHGNLQHLQFPIVIHTGLEEENDLSAEAIALSLEMLGATDSGNPDILVSSSFIVSLDFKTQLPGKITTEIKTEEVYKLDWKSTAWERILQKSATLDLEHDVKNADVFRPRMLPSIPRYEVLSELGQGGMGIVYKARELETDEVVALKVLKPKLSADPKLMSRFKNELRLARRITHKNICRIYEFNRTEDLAYISMEYVEGESLRTVLENKPLSIEEAAAIARQICSGLGEAHAQGIIHRDLKPENILLDETGSVKVMDFGVARSGETRMTIDGAIIGTPRYMAPEQAQGKAVDTRSDIYSLGLILYELFTGKAAYGELSIVELLLKQIQDTPQPPSELVHDLPSSIEQAILRCIEKNPDFRFQSVAEVAEALNLSGGPGPRPRTPATLQSKGGRVFRIVAVSCIVLVSILFLGYYFLVFEETELSLEYEEFTLANGLRVIYSEDHTAPTFTLCVCYKVGTANEAPSQMGFTHLFEHLMFQGSENVGRGEFWPLVERAGGQANGYVSADSSIYFITLPSNQLDLGLFLEADRMRSLSITQASIDNEIRVIRGEVRQHVNAPYGQTGTIIYNTAYDNFAYAHSPLEEVQLDNVAIADVQAFHAFYYIPNNAVIAIVGDFDPTLLREKIRSYFESIPSGKIHAAPDVSEPEQLEERRRSVGDPLVQTSRLDIAYKIPPAYSPDWFPSKVLVDILAGSESARLYEKLVKEGEMVVSITGWIDEKVGPSLAVFSMWPRPKKDLDNIEQMVYLELQRLRKKNVDQGELERVMAQSSFNNFQNLETTLWRAIRLAQYAAIYNQPDLINSYATNLARVSAEDIRRVAAKYFSARNRTVISTLPEPRSAATARDKIEKTNEPDETADYTAKIERKDRAPISTEFLKVSLPEPTVNKLENGLTLMIVEDHRTPNVVIRFRIEGSGPLYEPPDQTGLAYLTAEMLLEGTTNRTSREITQEFERLGSSIQTLSSFGSPATIIQAEGLSRTFEKWFAVIVDTLLNPTFPADEFNRRNSDTKTIMQVNQPYSQTLAMKRFLAVVYGEHPAANFDVSEESLEALTPERLAQWHAQRYIPQNTVLEIIGDVRADELTRKLSRLLSGWKKGTIQQSTLPEPASPSEVNIHLIDRPGSNQSTFVIGSLAVDGRHPDFLPLQVMNRIIGQGPSSRLASRLRQEKGYVYTVQSAIVREVYPATWKATASVANKVTGPALEILLNTIRELREKPVPTRELEEAKHTLVAMFVLSLEKKNSLLDHLNTIHVYGFSADYWDTYPSRLMSISAREVQQVARKYLDPEKLQIVAVGDATKIRKTLEHYGPVKLYSIPDL
ncbi:insulinase family protein [candidate division CSSED10-310 bacterium]|uniref:Insulinase family protein n=1 Tax=candidate division CSSED10-310 bacterium TaxID=2855610 RepID=A0ABV6YXM0_UNCC1